MLLTSRIVFKRICLLVFITAIAFNVNAQDSSETVLEDVEVKAYSNGKLGAIAAAVNYIGRNELNKYAGVSFVSAINNLPGITLEERSPGSYRLNIRGSSLRSPFGVRNVKIYYNDIPFTDPGGTTYLNAIGYYDVQSLQIIKGPGSSMYGVGTGGVMLIETMRDSDSSHVDLHYSLGSYGLHNFHAGWENGKSKVKFKTGYQHQQANGYRVHSAMKKDVVSTSAFLMHSSSQQLQLSILYTHLLYETPGALTLNEYNSDPTIARPASGIFPSAEQAKAAIFQNNLLLGFSYKRKLSKQWQNTSVLYFAYNTLRNPAIRNYGSNIEPHLGGRTFFSYERTINSCEIKVDAGAEFQQNFHKIDVFTNNGGNKGALQSRDKVHTKQYLLFAQSLITYRKWTLSAGSSLNNMRVQFENLFPLMRSLGSVHSKNVLAPRISLLRKMGRLSVYAAIEKGFSPPAASELLPSGSALNLDLYSEEGWNRELGLRGRFAKHIYIDVNAFSFSLSNTIVQRRDAGGGDFFINGGATRQHGVESMLSIYMFNENKSVEASKLWINHAWHSFYYRNFKQLTNDYSGNGMPGNAKNVTSAGFDLQLKSGFNFFISYLYSSKIFLNDANNAASNSYHLLGVKTGYKLYLKTTLLNLSAGVDNLLDQKYSLGNDINAAGGRYYNAAAARNYYLQLSVSF